MASNIWPVRGSAYTFGIPGMYSQADPTIFQVNPTIAAGDFWISKDRGGWNALTNTPTLITAGSVDTIIEFVLTATEMTADEVMVKWIDAAGAEWIAGAITIRTAARGVDDLAFPTTSGRGIDVSAGGEVGIDWANIGSPTTAVNLSGTTVKTATDVETDTQDIQGRLPAALVSGRIDASVGAMAANTFTASALAADAVTEMQSGLSTLDAAGVRTAVGLASANLDTQLAALPTAAENAAEVLSEAASTPIAANVKEVNDVALTGDGSTTPWGPA